MQKIEMYDDCRIKLSKLPLDVDACNTWQIRRLSVRDYAQEILRISFAYFIENTHEDV